MQKNQLGYKVLDHKNFQRLFGDIPRAKTTDFNLDIIQKRMDDFGIETPIQNIIEWDFVEELPLPMLKGRNIKDHFEKIAKDQISYTLDDIQDFEKLELSEPPKDIIFQSGWTFYPWEGKPYSIKEPFDDFIVYDTETFVVGGNFPVIGTAVGKSGYYLWLAKELLETDLPIEEWDQYKLIPVGKNKTIAAYNASFDRIRSREPYEFSSEPDNFWLDVLSMHISSNGLASQQRFFYVKTQGGKKVKYYPKWVDKGSTNSLVATYNFHVYEKKKWFKEQEPYRMESEGKEIRNIFVKSTTLKPIQDNLSDLIDYAFNDTFRTAELFQHLWPKYRNATPSNVALAGHYFLGGSQIPLDPEWKNWIKSCDSVYYSMQEEIQNIGEKVAKKIYKNWRERLEKDLEELPRIEFKSREEFLEWIEDKSEEVRKLFISRQDKWRHPLIPGTTNKKTKKEDLLKLHFALGWIPKRADNYANSNPWLKQLDWSYKLSGKYAFLPAWWIKTKNLTTKSDIFHLLMELEWNGHPLYKSKDQGWGYFAETGEFHKVPHPEGKGDNVGQLLTKNFIKSMEDGTLSSKNPEAERALEIAYATSYWISVQSRVKELIVKRNLFVPDIIPAGTITRRCTGTLLPTLTKTNSRKIGTELKSRIQAPEGYKMIYGDFDAQEMAIAAIYADKEEGGIIGASALGHAVFNGDKSTASDAHTKLAREVFYKPRGIDYKEGEWKFGKQSCSKDQIKEIMVTRNEICKPANFAVLYGSGIKGLSGTLSKGGVEDPYKVAKKLLESTKGKKEKNGSYQGGMFSGFFNYAERIADRMTVPTLPVLGTKISESLRPNNVQGDFKNCRLNFTVQASGSEMLRTILVAAKWLAKEFKINLHFIISIHDELCFMAKDEDIETAVKVFQLAHLYSWALFFYQVGINDIPLSKMFFSEVAVDQRFRKAPDESTKTISHNKEEKNGYVLEPKDIFVLS